MTSPAPNRAPAPTGALACGPAAASSVGESAYPGFVDPSYPYPAMADGYGYAPISAAAPGAGSGESFPGTEYLDVNAIFADGGYTSPAPVTNLTARAALWFSVFGFLGLPILISAILACIGLMRAQSLPERIGTHEAIAALTYDAVLVVIWGFLYLPPLFR